MALFKRKYFLSACLIEKETRTETLDYECIMESMDYDSDDFLSIIRDIISEDLKLKPNDKLNLHIKCISRL